MVDKAAFFVYLGVFSMLVATGLGFPLPEELPILTAGAWVGHTQAEPDPYQHVYPIAALFAETPITGFPGNKPWAALYQTSEVKTLPPREPPVRLRWYIMLPVCILGVVVGDGFLYGMGRYWGPRLLESRWAARFLPKEKRQRIEDNFHKYGVLVLLFARFLPAIRSPIFITAGIMRVSFARFLLADGLYAIPGVSALFFLAYWFGNQFTAVILRAEERLKGLVIIAGLSALAGFLLYHFLRHPVAIGDPGELPVIGGPMASKIEHAQHPEKPPAAESKPSTGKTASVTQRVEAAQSDGRP